LIAAVRDVPTSEKDLGKLLSTHPIAPAYMQRAAIVAVVSFVFFLAMLIVFYIRQHIGYFALSTAFLVVYTFTLVGWVMQRRNVVSIYEGGLKYKKFSTAWNEIESVTAKADGLTITKSKREKTLIPTTVTRYDRIVDSVKRGVQQTSAN
jgi:hypothetical protein